MFLPFVGMLAIWTKVRKNTFNLPIDKPTSKSTYIEGESLDVVGWMMMSPKYYNTLGFKTPKVNLVDIQKSCNHLKSNDFIYFKSFIDYENVTDSNSEPIDVDFVKYLTENTLSDIIDLIKKGPTVKLVEGLIKHHFYYEEASNTIFEYNQNLQGKQIYDGVSYLNLDYELAVLKTARKPFQLSKSTKSVISISKKFLDSTNFIQT